MEAAKWQMCLQDDCYSILGGGNLPETSIEILGLVAAIDGWTEATGLLVFLGMWRFLSRKGPAKTISTQA